MVIKLKSNLLVTWAVAGTLGNTIHTINIAGGSPSFVPTAKIKGDVGRRCNSREIKLPGFDEILKMQQLGNKVTGIQKDCLTVEVNWR